MKTTTSFLTAAVIGVSLLSGCASNGPTYSSQPYYSANQNTASTYGTIEAIQVVRGSTGSSSGGGALLGGVVGGLLGNTIGGGTGRTAATVVGAVGGAAVGNNIEKNRNGGERDLFQITVRLDNGATQTLVQDSMNDLYVGNRVRIDGDRVFRY